MAGKGGGASKHRVQVSASYVDVQPSVLLFCQFNIFLFSVSQQRLRRDPVLLHEGFSERGKKNLVCKTMMLTNTRRESIIMVEVHM